MIAVGDNNGLILGKIALMRNINNNKSNNNNINRDNNNNNIWGLEWYSKGEIQ